MNSIDYKTLTEEQLEEWADVVDWSLVPTKFIIPEIKKEFGSIVNCQLRFSLEEIFSNLVIKIDEHYFPEVLFFFIENKSYLFFNRKRRILNVSFKKMWMDIFKDTFQEKYIRNDELYQGQKDFIKNSFITHFNCQDIKNDILFYYDDNELEIFFKNIKIVSSNNLFEYED